jgi:hypothetical protein
METTKRIMMSLFFVAMALTLFSFDIPTGWFKAGNKPKSYDMGIDKGAGQNGTNAATIKSIDKTITGFGTLMQNCLPDNYIGKRVRMSGFLKTKDVSDWSGFWLRIDQKDSQETLGFDNMHDGKKDRSIKGTTDWTKYEIVLDVPLKASNIAFGALLAGTGQIWFDNLKFEIVDNSVPTTGNGSESIMPLKEPTNLDFEK